MTTYDNAISLLLYYSAWHRKLSQREREGRTGKWLLERIQQYTLALQSIIEPLKTA